MQQFVVEAICPQSTPVYCYSDFSLQQFTATQSSAFQVRSPFGRASRRTSKPGKAPKELCRHPSLRVLILVSVSSSESPGVASNVSEPGKARRSCVLVRVHARARERARARRAVQRWLGALLAAPSSSPALRGLRISQRRPPVSQCLAPCFSQRAARSALILTGAPRAPDLAAPPAHRCPAPRLSFRCVSPLVSCLASVSRLWCLAFRCLAPCFASRCPAHWCLAPRLSPSQVPVSGHSLSVAHRCPPRH